MRRLWLFWAAGILVRLGYGLIVRVFYNDKCFYGACSAALFSRFYRERIREDADFVFSGLVHRAGALFDESHFDGDENAIVDFKYSSSPKITWWFDLRCGRSRRNRIPAFSCRSRRDRARRRSAGRTTFFR